MTPQLVLAFALSTAIGIALGLLGGGGSILAVPMLVYVLGMKAKAAIVMSLAIVGATSLMAGYMHWRSGQVDLRLACLFGTSGIAGSFLGAHAHSLLPGALLLVIFSLLMLVSGTLMIMSRGERAKDRPPKKKGVSVTLLVGFLVGFLTGFLGVGGGFMIVPAMVLIEELPMRLAIGSSLVVIAINAAAGFLTHLTHGTVQVSLTAGLTVMACLGAYLGKRLSLQVSPDNLKRGFGILVIVVAAFLATANHKAAVEAVTNGWEWGAD